MTATPKAIVDASGVVSNVVMAGPDFTAPSGCTLVDAGPGAQPGATYANGVFTPPPTPAPSPYLTGGDVIDGMSPAQASAPGVDVRDIVRIQSAPTADEVKSKIARIEKALKVPSGTLVGQAKPTGGT